MNEDARLLRRYPSGIPIHIRYESIQGHGELQGNEWPARPDPFEENLVQPGSFLLQNTGYHLHSGSAQNLHPPARNPGVGVDVGNDHSTYPRPYYRIGAGGHLPVEGVGLQVHVHGSAHRIQPRILNSPHLRMSFPIPPVITYAHHPSLLNDYRTHERIWRHESPSQTGKAKSKSHELLVIHGKSLIARIRKGAGVRPQSYL